METHLLFRRIVLAMVLLPKNPRLNIRWLIGALLLRRRRVLGEGGCIMGAARRSVEGMDSCVLEDVEDWQLMCVSQARR